MKGALSGILTIALIAPLTVSASDIHKMSEKEKAAYCSGVLGQQSLLFLQLSSIHKDRGNQEPYRNSIYNANQLELRARTLQLYGQNQALTDRGYKETSSAIQKAKAENKNPLNSFYGKTTECIDFYKAMQGRPNFQKYEKEAIHALKQQRAAH